MELEVSVTDRKPDAAAGARYARFRAEGKLKRSEFGMVKYIDVVGDTVDFSYPHRCLGADLDLHWPVAKILHWLTALAVLGLISSACGMVAVSAAPASPSSTPSPGLQMDRPLRCSP